MTAMKNLHIKKMFFLHNFQVLASLALCYSGLCIHFERPESNFVVTAKVIMISLPLIQNKDSHNPSPGLPNCQQGLYDIIYSGRNNHF
jgi:hypothetical protein